jgi:hypothetical protein
MQNGVPHAKTDSKLESKALSRARVVNRYGRDQELPLLQGIIAHV